MSSLIGVRALSYATDQDVSHLANHPLPGVPGPSSIKQSGRETSRMLEDELSLSYE